MKILRHANDSNSITASHKNGRVILTARDETGAVISRYSLSLDNADVFARNILDHARAERMALAAAAFEASKTRKAVGAAVATRGRRGAKSLLRVVKGGAE